MVIVTFPRALALALLLAGCSGAGAEPHPQGATSALSDSGNLEVTLKSSPQAVPVRGRNQLDLSIARVSSGKEVAGLTLAMLPFMPAMGHGSSVVPHIVEQAPGSYHVDDLVLPMPGLWELRTTVGAPENDQVTFRFDVE